MWRANNAKMTDSREGEEESFSGGGAPWMGSVGKKFEQLRDSPPYVFLRSFRLDSSLGQACFLMPKCVPGLGSTSALWFPFCFSRFFTVMLMSCIPLYSFTKSQKRASVLLSDVSQSIVCMEWSHHADQISSTDLTYAEHPSTYRTFISVVIITTPWSLNTWLYFLYLFFLLSLSYISGSLYYLVYTHAWQK